MGGFSNAIVGGAQKLIRAAIQSPNYVAGLTGWIVRKDGTAEFANATIRGSLTANSISGASIGTSSFQGGTINQSTETEPTIIFDSGGGVLLVYATTSTVTSYSSSGSFLVPAGITSVKAECWGGGAGGSDGNFNGPGGGGGEYAAEPTLTVTPGETLTVTVGAGGAGATLSNSQPGTGGTTTLKRSSTALVTAHGGQAAGGAGANTPVSGGSGSTNTTHFSGGGSPAQNVGATDGGCGGGGSGGTSQAGNSGATNSGNTGGAGGAAVTGGGAGGAGGAGTGTNGTAGANGAAPGGGGGSGGFGSSNGSVGGAGAAGQVRITYVTASTLIGSIAPAAGSDAAGNAYPQNMMGRLVAVEPSSSPQTPEVWHVPTTGQLGAGWAQGPTSGSYLNFQYRIDAQDNLILQGAVHTTSATPNGAIYQIPAVPAGWRPGTNWRGPGAIRNDAGTPTICWLEVDANGAIAISPNEAAANRDVYFMAFVPLGNIA